MNYLDYLRQNRLPLIWCTGCGNGIILKAMLRAIDRLGWRKDEIVKELFMNLCQTLCNGYGIPFHLYMQKRKQRVG